MINTKVSNDDVGGFCINDGWTKIKIRHKGSNYYLKKNYRIRVINM